MQKQVLDIYLCFAIGLNWYTYRDPLSCGLDFSYLCCKLLRVLQNKNVSLWTRNQDGMGYMANIFFRVVVAGTERLLLIFLNNVPVIVNEPTTHPMFRPASIASTSFLVDLILPWIPNTKTELDLGFLPFSASGALAGVLSSLCLRPYHAAHSPASRMAK